MILSFPFLCFLPFPICKTRIDNAVIGLRHTVSTVNTCAVYKAKQREKNHGKQRTPNLNPYRTNNPDPKSKKINSYNLSLCNEVMKKKSKTKP